MEDIQVVELHMMDKRKYFPLAVVSGFAVRGIIYPVALIKTRLQVQKKHDVYKGTFDAFGKIAKYEGFRGLYKGFWISNFMVVSQMSYISTYEGIRHYMASHTSFTNNQLRSFIAGGAASFVGQTAMVPIDIVSQHLQVLGSRYSSGPEVAKFTPASQLEIPPEALSTRFGPAKAITLAVYQKYGIKGFYKGYMASLAVYAPNSALWWFFYDIYSNSLAGYAPVWMPRLMLQVIAGPLSGVTTAVFTNPMDAIRARIQVEHTRFWPTAQLLWKEEHLGIITKGLSARLIQSITFSFFIILGYETIKRWSLLDEHKHAVRW